MGLFGDNDIAGAEDLGVKDGTYEGIVSNVTTTANKNDETMMNLILSYDLEDVPFPVREWKSFPHPDYADELQWDDTNRDEKGNTEKSRKKRAKSFMKERLRSLGVPQERMNSLDPDDLIGLPVVVTIKKGDNGYAQVVRVSQPVEGHSSLPSPQGPGLEEFAAATTSNPAENPWKRA